MRLHFLLYSDIACLGVILKGFKSIGCTGVDCSWVLGCFLPVFVPATAAADGAVLIGGPSTWFLVGNKLFLGGGTYT